jgi:signal transduction histidine kinase
MILSQPLAATDAVPGGPNLSVAARIRTRMVENLDEHLLSAAANIPAAIVTAGMLRGEVPSAWLLLWIGLLAATVAALFLTVRGVAPARIALGRRLATHVLFATAIGGMWGGACLAFGPLLTPDRMMFLAVIMTACNAACVTALGIYLPAYFGYAAASLLPLCYVSFVRPEAEAGGSTLLIVLYIITLAINARSHNQLVLAAFKLQAENEALAESVARANAATVAATRSKWDMLAHLSHELRTPMNAIIGFSDMMTEQMFGPLGDRYLGYAGHIHDSGRHALGLIDAILETSCAESGQLTLTEGEVATPALIEDCLHMVENAASAKHVTLESRLGQALPRIAADRAKLRQALLNLLTNAIKYTPRGGHVSITAEWVPGGLDIAVSDTGVGIAAEDLSRCVEPFVRLRNPHMAGVDGAGLGLPLAKRLVEAHGGSLRLASEPGQGTVATIHVPSARCLAA